MKQCCVAKKMVRPRDEGKKGKEGLVQRATSDSERQTCGISESVSLFGMTIRVVSRLYLLAVSSLPRSPYSTAFKEHWVFRECWPVHSD